MAALARLVRALVEGLSVANIPIPMPLEELVTTVRQRYGAVLTVQRSALEEALFLQMAYVATNVERLT